MVNIDTVYQKVLAIANKEQRGYITPQEFNLFADHAQKEIFEQYFYDLNQFRRVPSNNTTYSDIINNLEEKISLFEIYDDDANVVGDYGDININNNFPNLYRLTMVRVNYQTEPKVRVAEEIQLTELSVYADSPLVKWSKKRPVYTRYSTGVQPDRLKVYPSPSSDGNIDQVKISYIKKPTPPNWNYQVVNEKPFFLDNSDSIHFELHPSEEQELIYKILMLAGINLQRVDIAQVSANTQQSTIQQDKQ